MSSRFIAFIQTAQTLWSAWAQTGIEIPSRTLICQTLVVSPWRSWCLLFCCHLILIGFLLLPAAPFTLDGLFPGCIKSPVCRVHWRWCHITELSWLILLLNYCHDAFQLSIWCICSCVFKFILVSLYCIYLAFQLFLTGTYVLLSTFWQPLFCLIQHSTHLTAAKSLGAPNPSLIWLPIPVAIFMVIWNSLVNKRHMHTCIWSPLFLSSHDSGIVTILRDYRQGLD